MSGSTSTPAKNVPFLTVTGYGKMAEPPKVVRSRAMEAEDEFQAAYGSDLQGAGTTLIEPPYNPGQLQALCSENNTLGPCIQAMVTNVDETGHIIEKEGDAQNENDPVIKKLEKFFAEVYPGQSFLQLRRKVRRDLEQTGNAYIEVMRNLEGKLVFLRYAPARTMRCLRLGGSISIEKKIVREGVELKVDVMVRERRYYQLIGGEFIYFREFGSSRAISATHGHWDTPATPVALGDRGTEIIHLTINPNASSPYGMPRWEGQIPSVLGSRSSEEFNLEYFETGGVPPVLITLAGGAMAEEAKKALENQFNSKGRSKHRAMILETESTSGSLDSAGKVEVNVHAFGSERQSDALFQNYDTQCHIKVRRSFRLPSLFLGDLEGMNFAVAFTSYLVAENQVFRPERQTFDDMVNSLIMPEIGGCGYIFRSKNLSVADIQAKLAALQLAMATNRVDPKQIIDTINEVADLDLDATDKPVVPLPVPGAPGQPGQPGADGKPPGLPSGDKPPAIPGIKAPGGSATGGESTGGSAIKKMDVEVLDLADKAMIGLRRRDMQSLAQVFRVTDAMEPYQQDQFKSALALRQYFDPSIDPKGMTELAGCSLVGMFRSGALE